ncbi:MAG: hypothetical protein RL115_1452 [Bacteroidota bacterium]
MVTKIMYSIVKKCQKNWQYKNDESSCLFNAKILSSMLLYLNFLAILLLIFKKDKALQLMFFASSQNLLLALIYPAIFFIFLSLLFTKKRLNKFDLTQEEQKRYYKIYILFAIFTALFLAIAAILSNQS